jgi:succinoglycan biosynthesis transport protein ExoP
MSNQDKPPMVVPSPYHPSTPPASASPPLDYYYEESQGKNLREYFHILLKRKLWVIGTFLVIFLGVALFTFLRTPIYRPTAMLQITQDNPASQVSIDNTLSKLTGTSDTDKFLRTQYKILHSQSLALRVIKDLNLSQHPDYKAIRENNPKKSDSEIENLMIAAFLKRLEVTPVKNSFLVQVSYKSPDKVMAQRVVNAIANEYMNLSIDRRNQSFTLVRKWLDKQLGEMAGKVQAAQKKLYKFGQKTDIYTLDDKDNVIVQKYVDLSALLTKAQAEEMAKEAQYQQIKDKGPNAPLIVNNPLVAALRQQEVTEQAKVSAMRKVFRAGHPELKAELANLAEVKNRLNAEVRRIKDSVKADYEAANRTEKLLSDSFTAQKQQMAKLQDNLANYQILKRDAQTNEQLYQALLSRVKEANIAGTMVPSNVAVIDPGRLPDQPYLPKTKLDLALAAVLGLTLGVGLAFLTEHLDDSIKSLDDLERSCNLPMLGILPLIGTSNGKGAIRGKRKSSALGIRRYLPRLQLSRPPDIDAADMDLVVYKYPKSQLSEALQHVYSSIMLSVSGRPPCIIMVTSPNPGEGKSMIAANLAQSCALNERQVVLIDGDLRKPRLHQIFQLAPQPGLSNYLTGNATLEEVLRPTAIPNLSIITVGATPPSPSNLLNSDMFKKLLTQLRQQFRHIILDTPPVLGFADARFISPLTDGVLLVTKYQSTHKSTGRLANQLLSQAPVLGAVLNSVGVHGQTYGGYYYYYNHYKYYSKLYDGKWN